MGRVAVVGTAGACALGLVCVVLLISQGGDSASHTDKAPKQQLADVPASLFKTPTKAAAAAAAAAPTPARKVKLDVRNQAKLVRHPHMQYVNDVDQGLHDAIEQIRQRAAKLNSIPSPPRFLKHKPTADHHLDMIPLPPDHGSTTDEDDVDGDGDEHSAASTTTTVDTQSDASSTEDDSAAEPENNSVVPATRETVNAGRITINQGIRKLRQYAKSFKQRHDLLKKINQHETEVHARLTAEKRRQKQVRIKLQQRKTRQHLLHVHQVAVAKTQREIAKREERLANYLRAMQARLAKERHALHAHSKDEFAKVIKVEHDILRKIQKGAFLAPPASAKGHHVHINVNSPGGKPAPIHVHLKAKELGDNGDISIDINNHHHRHHRHHGLFHFLHKARVLKKLKHKLDKKHNKHNKHKRRHGKSKQQQHQATPDEIAKELDQIDKMIVSSKQAAQNAADEAEALKIPVPPRSVVSSAKK